MWVSTLPSHSSPEGPSALTACRDMPGVKRVSTLSAAGGDVVSDVPALVCSVAGAAPARA